MPNEKDYITNKVLIVFSACLFGVLGLMFLYKLLNSGSGFMVGYITVQALAAIGVIGIVAGIILMYLEKKNNVDTNFRLFTGRNVVLVSAFIGMSMALILNYDAYKAIKILYVILPAVAVYYLIFHSYQREFFVIAVDTGVAAAFMWVIGQAENSGSKQWMAYLVVAIAAVLAAGQLIWTLKVRKNGGLMKLRGKKEEVFASGANYTLMAVSAILMLIFLAAALFTGPQIAYYMMFAIFAYLFVLAVYYTVKLM